MNVMQEAPAPAEALAAIEPGTIWGVGLGPGEPELMSVRADRLVRGASHVAYFRKAGRSGQARAIVHQDGAGATFAAIATLLGAGQADRLAQVIEQQHVVGNEVLTETTVEGQAKDVLQDSAPNPARAVEVSRSGW